MVFKTQQRFVNGISQKYNDLLTAFKKRNDLLTEFCFECKDLLRVFKQMQRIVNGIF